MPCYMLHMYVFLCMWTYAHIHRYLELAICKDFHFLLAIKCLLKQAFIKAQLCARHCIVSAVVRMMLDETHETVNAVVLGTAAAMPSTMSDTQ